MYYASKLLLVLWSKAWKRLSFIYFLLIKTNWSSKKERSEWMADKLTKETLIMLEYAESRATGMQMPLWAQEYIKEHGIPDPNVVYKRQREKLGVERKLNTQDINTQRKLEAIIGTYGLNSPETDKAIFEAHKNGTSIKKLSRWVHKIPEWIKIRTESSEEYQEFKKLLGEEKNIYSRRMARFYREMKQSGISSSELALWTCISESQINKLVEEATPKYIAHVTYYVAIPVNTELSEKLCMLEGKIKPDFKPNRRELRKQVNAYLRTAGIISEFETKVAAKYSNEAGIDVKIEPIK